MIAHFMSLSTAHLTNMILASICVQRSQSIDLCSCKNCTTLSQNIQDMLNVFTFFVVSCYKCYVLMSDIKKRFTFSKTSILIPFVLNPKTSYFILKNTKHEEIRKTTEARCPQLLSPFSHFSFCFFFPPLFCYCFCHFFRGVC